MLAVSIDFNGKSAEAIAFYQKVFNADVNGVYYYRDAPPNSGVPVSEETKDFVMHSELILHGTRINICDVSEEVSSGMIHLNVFFNSADEVCNVFDLLKEGGKIIEALSPQFYSPMCGTVIDRFGIQWGLITE